MTTVITTSFVTLNTKKKKLQTNTVNTVTLYFQSNPKDSKKCDCNHNWSCSQFFKNLV